MVELPRLRPGAPPERLEVEGRELVVLASSLREVAGPETRWNVRLRTESPPGNVPLVLRAVYADGRSVEVEDALTVVPADETSFPWAVAISGTLLAVALTVSALFLVRRKP